LLNKNDREFLGSIVNGKTLSELVRITKVDRGKCWSNLKKLMVEQMVIRVDRKYWMVHENVPKDTPKYHSHPSSFKGYSEPTGTLVVPKMTNEQLKAN
jgi:hypothetical protein